MPVELDNFKASFHEKPVSEGLNEAEVSRFLDELYSSNEPVQLHKDSSKEEIRIFRQQAKALYKKGKDLGLVNLIELQGKFDAIKDGDVQQDGFHNINEIKKTMERIVFQVALDSEKGKPLDPKFNDYAFLCGEGTLTNMQSILQQLVLNSATVDDMLTLTKKQMIEQFVTEFYIKNKDFLEKMEGMHSHEIYEVHNISSLLNKVADDYGLIKKTKKDDQYLQEYINDDVQALLKSYVERQLNSEHSGEILIDLTADRIMSDLPKFEIGNDATFTQSIDEYIQNLDLADKLNVYSLLDIDEDTYQIKGYKEDALQIIKDTLAIHLHDKGTVLNADIDFLRAKIGFFDSQLQEVQGQEILEYIKSKSIEEKILLYALDKGHEIDGIDPVKWAIDNDLRINGQKAIEWALENDLQIDGKPAFSYAIEDLNINQNRLLKHMLDNDLKISNKPAFLCAIEDFGKPKQEVFDYLVNNNQNINGVNPVLWASEQDLQINGMDPVLYCLQNDLKIDGQKAIKWAVKNDLEIDGKPAFLYAVEDLGQSKDKLVKWAVKNDIKIRGESAIKLTVKHDEIIDGKPAFLYAVEDLGKKEESVLKYAIKNDVAIGGVPALEWAFINDKIIDGKQAMEFATTNNVNVNGTSVMDWIDKNADRLLAEKDGINREVVGKHTRRISEQSSTTKSISVSM